MAFPQQGRPGRRAMLLAADGRHPDGCAERESTRA
jgi:hypothetical protein